jgi:Transposase IS66 family
VELGCCPHCAGALEAKQPLVQYLEELPPVRAHVTRLKTYEAHCPRCQRLVRSVHPRQTSTAGGCAGVQLGARALAVAVELKHELGLSLSKVAKVLSKVGGLQVSRGGLALAYQRISAKVAGEDAALRAQLAKAPVLHTDETSWWVNGPASLWVFVVPGAQGLTLYRVVAHRDRVTFHSTVPADYGGLLISDCLSVYDGATAHQHKCYAHHLRALRVARCDQHPQSAAASPWLTQVRAFLEATMELKIRWPTLADLERERQRAQCEVLANALFAQPRGDPAEERFLCPHRQATRPSLKFPGPPTSRGHQQSCRTTTAPRSHRPQSLLWSENSPRRGRLGNPRLTRRHLRSTRRGLRRIPRSAPPPLSRRLNRYHPSGVHSHLPPVPGVLPPANVREPSGFGRM